jgi:hypothetical protein
VREAAAKARQRAKEQQAKLGSKAPYLIWTGKRAEPKGGETTMWTMIPYIVKESHHPDGAATGELWYKRPYMIHRNMGAEELTKVCPKSFNPRAACAVHVHVNEMRKDWDENKDAIGRVRESQREVYLIYDHDSKEVALYDAAYGSVKNPGFGYLLASRIENPLADEWSAFWLDGDDGMALRITWQESTFATGSGSWIRPISIDFAPRKAAPVPKDVWAKAVELSEVLEKISSDDMEALYEGYHTSDRREEEPPPEAGEEPPEEEVQEPAPQEPNWDLMDKASLISYAKDIMKLDAKILRTMTSLQPEKLREDLAGRYWHLENDDIPFEGAGGGEQAPEPAKEPARTITSSGLILGRRTSVLRCARMSPTTSAVTSRMS